MRKIIGEQLNYVKHNLGYIDQYISEHSDCLDSLRPLERKRLDTIRILYAQQREMYEKKSHNVLDRIVSLSQPHIRPIVRGKQKSKVEFGAKMSMSVINGFCFIDELSFDSYNEGAHDHFIQVVEKYRERFGVYPERVMADKIYGNRQNRKWCKEHGIYLSAEPLGRKPKDQRKLLKQMREDMGVRNEVECKFGNMKRRGGLDLIMSKLSESAKIEIHLSVICRNLVNLVRFSQA